MTVIANVEGFHGYTGSTDQSKVLEGKGGEVWDGVNPIAGQAEVAQSWQGVQARDCCDLVTCKSTTDRWEVYSAVWKLQRKCCSKVASMWVRFWGINLTNYCARCIIFLLINREMAKDIRLWLCGRVEKFLPTLQGEKRVRGASSMVSCV